MYRNDQRTVITLDAGGTNFVFGAIRANKFIVDPITLPSNADDLDKCMATLVDGFEQVMAKLDHKPVAISFAFPGPADYANGIVGGFYLPNFPSFRDGVALGPFLEEKFGIPVLLEAFGKIKDENVKLVLCGTGDAQELIAKKQLEDNRIIAPGRVDRKKALALQRGATVLVNPRQNNEEFTKYSFPSKNLEYLSSGVPVVAYKLDGIPDEYDDYINYPADDSAEAMCNELERLLGMTDEERKAVGQRAKEFVLGTKNKVQQTKRIIDFLNT